MLLVTDVCVCVFPDVPERGRLGIAYRVNVIDGIYLKKGCD